MIAAGTPRRGHGPCTTVGVERCQSAIEGAGRSRSPCCRTSTRARERRGEETGEEEPPGEQTVRRLEPDGRRRARGPKASPRQGSAVRSGFPGRRDPAGHREGALGVRFEPAARDRPAAAHEVNGPRRGERTIGRGIRQPRRSPGRGVPGDAPPPGRAALREPPVTSVRMRARGRRSAGTFRRSQPGRTGLE